MASVNRITLVGHVGRDVECRYLPSGDPVASFSLATTETWKTKEGQKRESTQWHQISVFGKLAEIARDYVTKGRQLFVEGQMVYEEYVDKAGIKKTSAKVKLSGPRAQLVLLGKGDGGQSRSDGDGSQGQEYTRDDSPETSADDSDLPF